MGRDPASPQELFRLGPVAEVEVTGPGADEPDFRLDFRVDGERFDVRMGGPFIFTTVDGRVLHCESEEPESIALVRESLRSIVALVATDDGVLTITGHDGSQLIVPPDDMYEVWIIRNYDGYVLPSPMLGR